VSTLSDAGPPAWGTGVTKVAAAGGLYKSPDGSLAGVAPVSSLACTRSTRQLHPPSHPAHIPLAGAPPLAQTPLLAASIQLDAKMVHRVILLVAALSLVAAAGLTAPTPTAADARYAAVIAVGDKGVWPYCAVTGWKPLTLPCPPGTVCRPSWVNFGRSASNCFVRETPRCSLSACARRGATAPCFRGLLGKTTCGAYAQQACDKPRGCPAMPQDKPPVCDSTGKRWRNLCVLEVALCNEGFEGATGPIPGQC